MSLKDTIIQDVAKASPPAAIAGITGNEILIGISILYVVLQIAHLVWKWNKERNHDSTRK